MAQLRNRRLVQDKVRLAGWGTGPQSKTASLRIDVEGCDPRIVVVPRVWIQRQAPPSPDVATGVTWSAYSAGRDGYNNLIPLQVVEGANARAVSFATQADGTAGGDNGPGNFQVDPNHSVKIDLSKLKMDTAGGNGNPMSKSAILRRSTTSTQTRVPTPGVNSNTSISQHSGVRLAVSGI